jgi:hypothetical protein
MNFFSAILYTAAMVSLIACTDTNGNTHKNLATDLSAIKTKDSTTAEDSIALTALVKNIYQWHERSLKETRDFDVKKEHPADTLFKGIDWVNHNNILNKLRKTGFFAAEFLENYQNIALQIDKALKSGTTIWPVNELPTIAGYEADPWFSAQDFPENNYWERMILKNIQWNKDLASFLWSVDDQFNNTMKAKKENGTWKISYMQGFNPKNYVITD